jgi:hypothetical protein
MHLLADPADVLRVVAIKLVVTLTAPQDELRRAKGRGGGSERKHGNLSCQA